MDPVVMSHPEIEGQHTVTRDAFELAWKTVGWVEVKTPTTAPAALNKKD